MSKEIKLYKFWFVHIMNFTLFAVIVIYLYISVQLFISCFITSESFDALRLDMSRNLYN